MTWLKGKFFILLTSLFSFLVLSGFLTGSILGRVPLEMALSLVLLITLYSISDKRVIFIIGVVLNITGLSLDWLAYITHNSMLLIISSTIILVYLIFVTGVVLVSVLKEGEITADLIFGAISGYLLIGMAWGFAFMLLEYLTPGSLVYAMSGEMLANPDLFTRADLAEMFYHSYVSLTTLGYGDIVPVSRPARTFSYLAAAMGQVYLTVLIGRLVGLHISQTSKKNDDRVSLK